MTQPVPEPRYRDANDLLMSGGAPSFKFARIGDTITGTVLRMDMAVQRDPVTQLPKHYEKTGEEKMQLVITLQTDLRDPAVERDDGRRRIFVKEYGQPKMALQQAVRDSGEPGLTIGGRLTDTYIGDAAPTFPGGSGEKLHRYEFTGPAGAAATDGQQQAAAGLAGILGATPIQQQPAGAYGAPTWQQPTQAQAPEPRHAAPPPAPTDTASL